MSTAYYWQRVEHRSHDPRTRSRSILEYPFDQLDEFLTPNDLFYIPVFTSRLRLLDCHDYKLSIYGAVENAFEIRL